MYRERIASDAACRSYDCVITVRNPLRNTTPDITPMTSATATTFQRATYAHDNAITNAPTITAPDAAMPNPRRIGVQPDDSTPAARAIGPHAPIGLARL